MEKFEVSKAVEVFGTMRQVVVTGTGADTLLGSGCRGRGARRCLELAHEDVHAFAHKTLKAVGAKPAKGSSHRRVRCDPTASDYRYGDVEEALVRAGYAPDVPSVWVLQDVGSVDIRKWNDLVEEIGDLMCAGSEIVAHAPSLGPPSSLILTSAGTKPGRVWRRAGPGWPPPGAGAGVHGGGARVRGGGRWGAGRSGGGRARREAEAVEAGDGVLPGAGLANRERGRGRGGVLVLAF